MFEFLLNSRPFGHAFLIAALMSIAAGMVDLLASPTIDKYRIEFASDEKAKIQDLKFWAKRSAEAAGCISFDFSSLEDWAIIECSLPSSSDLWNVNENVPSGFVLVQIGIESGRGNSDSLGILPSLLILLAFLAVAAFLTRDVDLRSDLAHCTAFLKKRPWIIFLVPVCSFLALSFFSALLPGGSGFSQQDLDFLFSPSLLLLILIGAPILEEAVFRHWAYVRTIEKLPVALVALGTSWFFMLSHVLNPQALAAYAYLPTVFCVGMALFVVRHWSGSITLTMICHVLNNSLPFIIASLLAKAV